MPTITHRPGSAYYTATISGRNVILASEFGRYRAEIRDGQDSTRDASMAINARSAEAAMAVVARRIARIDAETLPR